MSVKHLNDAPILGQLDDWWEKLFMVLLFKLKGAGHTVTVTAADIMALGALYPPHGPVLFTHGHKDSIDFRIVDHEAAVRIAEHQKTQEGTA